MGYEDSVRYGRCAQIWGSVNYPKLRNGRYVCMIDGEDMGEEGPESVPSEHKLYVCTVAW